MSLDSAICMWRKVASLQISPNQPVFYNNDEMRYECLVMSDEWMGDGGDNDVKGYCNNTINSSSFPNSTNIYIWKLKTAVTTSNKQ